MKTIAFICSLFIVNLGIAQVAVDEAKRNIFGNPFITANQNYINLLARMESDDANQFLFDDWTSMSVESHEGRIMQVDSANYQITANAVYFFKNGQLYQLHNRTTDRIVLDKRLFKNIRVDEGKYESKLFEVLVEGEMMLLKEHYLRSENTNSHPMGLRDPNSQKMVRKDRLYYYDSKRDKLDKLPRSKAKLIRIFGRGNNRLVSYANKNDLSSTSEEDLISLFKYHNNKDEQ